ncbi:hypothetical protein KIW84_055636 [Lathyrus oleraceus]|uniref:Uncharacterized protein n=1 Tax=Pisum sativum TaxID=3888 RepID=A0A9D4WZ52_PEA|nr:hypothetical protein KIW84_055636 [Pisum sativum]
MAGFAAGLNDKLDGLVVINVSRVEQVSNGLEYKHNKKGLGMARMIAELTSSTTSENGLTFEEAMEERLCVYSRVIVHFPATVKEVKMKTFIMFAMPKIQMETCSVKGLRQILPIFVRIGNA